MPSQKRIVSGFNKDIKKPEKNDLVREILWSLLLWMVLPTLTILSIPVYTSTKKPKDHNNVCIKGVPKKFITPRYTVSIYKASAHIAPRPTNQEGKNPPLMPLSICAALIGPIGAARDIPRKT